MPRQRSVITVGNFDGVHRGHRALLDAARAEADRAEGDGGGAVDVVAVTFERHPLSVLRPDRAPRILMDADQRSAALLEAGADRIEWLQPAPQVLGLAPERFVDMIVERYRPIAWLEGPDFRFGHRATGDVGLLRELGAARGFAVRVVEPVEATLRDKTRCRVSSSLVRWLLETGRVADAHLCLTRPYAVRGAVAAGEGRGRAIGFPTANLATGERQLPADGVYAGEVELDGEERAAAVSVGTKPTFGERERVFEAYVLDFDGDLYGRTIDVKLLRWLRDQMPFPTVEGLIEQMGRDVERVRALRSAGLGSAAELAAGNRAACGGTTHA